MTTSWGWIGPYFIVIVLAVLVGPFLATLPLFTHTFVRPLGMNAAQAVRFVADGICLLMIWSAASRARRDLKDNGKGQTFLRAILFPSAFLLIVIAACQAYEAHGISVLGPPKQPLYNWLITGGPGDVPLGERIASEIRAKISGGAVQMLNLAGKTSLRELCILLSIL